MTTKSEFLEAHDEQIQQEFNEIIETISPHLKKNGAYMSEYRFDCAYGVTKRVAELLVEKYEPDGWNVHINMKSVHSNGFEISIT